MKYEATFHNDEYNMTSVVFLSQHKTGGFGVGLRDDDSGLMVGMTIHGIKTIALAIETAKHLVNN